ncbi:MAG: amidohydrolase family protein [Thermomicrobiales bacterium]
MEIIDAHVHLFPPDFARDRLALAARDPWFALTYGDGRARMATAEELVTSLDGAGIAAAVACGWPWRDAGLCRAHNDYLLDAARRFAGRILPLAIVAPLTGHTAVTEAERTLAAGAAGLGELNADAQGFDLADPAPLAGLANLLIQTGKPLLLHTSEPLGHRYPGKGTATPEKVVAFLLAYASLRVVAAHWGGGLPFYTLMPEVAVATQNLWYDSAASTYLYRFDVFAHVAALVSPDRILWGTDWPLLRQAPFLRRTLAAGLPDAGITAILGGNARHLYRG